MADSGVAGYTLGGGAAHNLETTDVSKFAFPSDSRSTLGTGVSAASRHGSAMADSGVAGYLALGNSYFVGDLDAMNRFAFPSDTRSLFTMVVSRSKRAAAFANCAALSP